MKTISLTLIAAAVLGYSTLGAMAQDTGYANPELLVAPEQLADAIEFAGEHPTIELFGEPVVLVDVRPAEAFEAGHIPGAMRIDPDAVTAPDSPIGGALRPVEEVAEMLEELGITSQTRVVYYDGADGLHAARMFWLTEYLGHQRVSLLDGGLQAWRETGGIVSVGAGSVPEPGAFTPAPMPRRFAAADWILAHREAPDVVVVDVRPTALFEKGHIPWAINLPWKGNMAENGRMKPADALIRHFEENGVTFTSNVVVHCEVGLASSHSYFALRLVGHPRVRTYHRSWSEWGSSPELPKAQTSGG